MLAMDLQEMAARARALEAAAEAAQPAAGPAPARSTRKPPRPTSKVYAKEQAVLRELRRLGRASYRDLKSVLGEHGATPVYRLRDRGEVRRNDDGTYSIA